ncbi:hypothetical protein MTX78_24895 (plasmid) [Hymenobacter tibetensis]|uniref:Uncharacterized protein n=1 Tax=Hymenobacter tibetensis TaxID=497967 RepID=A0ABY4D584_9BACT|nr:hypothetical protein [Hymenobacter tibetensis]UOG77650.1 hypothetical protein MTX78_24895 [Hymenobacter tibetensis]
MATISVRNRLTFDQVGALAVGDRLLEVDFPEHGLYLPLRIASPPRLTGEGTDNRYVTFLALLEDDQRIVEFSLSEQQYAFGAPLYTPENVLFLEQ